MDAYQVVRDFEKAVAEYAGAPFAVAVDSCTNALFLSLLLVGVDGETVRIPSRTYPSVPCAVLNAGGFVEFEDVEWSGMYRLVPTPVVDGAKRFTHGMYEDGMLHCLSFHYKKHLPIGRGGMVLTDDERSAAWLRRKRFDGRREIPLHQDDFDMTGWNMYMTPDQAARGLALLGMLPRENDDLVEEPPYPDLSKCSAYRLSGRDSSERIKRIHVNQHRIRSNLKLGESEPVLAVKSGKSNDYAHEVAILDDRGNEVARVVCRPDRPLSCGARCWIETKAKVVLKGHNG